MNKYMLFGLGLGLTLSTTASAEHYACSRLIYVEDCSKGCNAEVIRAKLNKNVLKKTEYQFVLAKVMIDTTQMVECLLTTKDTKYLYLKGDNVIVTSKMYDRDNSGVTIIEISKNND